MQTSERDPGFLPCIHVSVIDDRVDCQIEVACHVTGYIVNGRLQGPPTMDVSSCGIKKGCYRYPDKCHVDTCDNIFTWKDHGDTIQFEVHTKIDPSIEGDNPWIGAGFSTDGNMVSSYVYMSMVNYLLENVH